MEHVLRTITAFMHLQIRSHHSVIIVDVFQKYSSPSFFITSSTPTCVKAELTADRPVKETSEPTALSYLVMMMRRIIVDIIHVRLNPNPLQSFTPMHKISEDENLFAGHQTLPMLPLLLLLPVTKRRNIGGLITTDRGVWYLLPNMFLLLISVKRVTIPSNSKKVSIKQVLNSILNNLRNPWIKYVLLFSLHTCTTTAPPLPQPV